MKTFVAAAAIALAIGAGSAHACPTLVSAVLSVSVLTATSANAALVSVHAGQSVYDTIVTSLANTDTHHTYSSSNNVADPSMTNAAAAGALGAVLMSSRKFGHPKGGT